MSETSGGVYPVTWQQLEFEKAQRAAIIEECARVYDEYIALLEEALNNLAGLAFSHGYQAQPDKVQRGEELRVAIRALKDRP